MDAKIHGTIGNRAYRYCTYCECRGVRSTGMYCPISHPLDAPGSVNQENWNDYDRANLPMRTNIKFRKDAAHIEETKHKEAADLTGISALAILAQLPSIDFPRSFPPDSMHLFFENVIPALSRHYRGVFFKVDHRTREESDNEEAQPDRQSANRGSRKRKRTATKNSGSTATATGAGVDQGRNPRRGKGGDSHLPHTTNVKFKKTLDVWNVEPKVWEQIGRDQKVWIWT